MLPFVSKRRYGQVLLADAFSQVEAQEHLKMRERQAMTFGHRVPCAVIRPEDADERGQRRVAALFRGHVVGR